MQFESSIYFQSTKKRKMVSCVETGDLRPRTDADEDGKGCFTVKCNDVPLASLRRKPAKQKTQKKKVRLTPINEEILRESSFVSVRDAEDSGVSSGSSTSGMSEEDAEVLRRSATPVLRQQLNISKLLSDVADAYEEELENIPEGSSTRVRDPEIKQILCDLPPRPKCSRKVLPPSVTGPKDETKKAKLLRRRSKQSLERISSVSPLKELDSKKLTPKDLKQLERPKSAESGVRVIRLADLSSVNSTSVPDLPSIISKLSKPLSEDFRKVTEFDESGALSTPRRPSEPGLGMAPWDSTCLRGNDIASFYNMWERDRKRRPFDKKEPKKHELKVNRSCLCAIRQYGINKCGIHTKKHFLPPLN